MDLEEPEEEENIAEEVWAKEEEECLRPREGMLECLKIVSVLNVVELSPINCGSSMTRQFVSPGFSDSPGQASSNLIPKIEADLCTGCGKCLESCPVDAITVVNKKAIINEYRCNACRACMPACPVDAIK